jgi:hypothetical protein
MSDYKPF